MKFFQCAHCGNIIAYVEDKGVPVMCCGEKMQEIIPGSVDAATEKHVPLLEQTGVYVTGHLSATRRTCISFRCPAWDLRSFWN